MLMDYEVSKIKIMKDIMIYKNDEGWWKIVTDTGESLNSYKTYEDAVYSLPKRYWGNFI